MSVQDVMTDSDVTYRARPRAHFGLAWLTILPLQEFVADWFALM